MRIVIKGKKFLISLIQLFMLEHCHIIMEVCFEDGETNKINQNLDILEELVNQEIIDDI
jgi:hypothetical protein